MEKSFSVPEVEFCTGRPKAFPLLAVRAGARLVCESAKSKNFHFWNENFVRAKLQ
jgi:hypothetical protein